MSSLLQLIQDTSHKLDQYLYVLQTESTIDFDAYEDLLNSIHEIGKILSSDPAQHSTNVHAASQELVLKLKQHIPILQSHHQEIGLSIRKLQAVSEGLKKYSR